MKNKRAIRKTLKNSLNLRFNIKALSPTQEQIDRSLFIDSIETMVEIQDRIYLDYALIRNSSH